METNQILVLIDAEISKLQRAKAILSATTEKLKLAKPVNAVKRIASKKKTAPTLKPKLTRSPEVRARMAAAQQARYARARKAAA